MFLRSTKPTVGFTTKTSKPELATAQYKDTARLETFHVSIHHSTTYIDRSVDIANILQSPLTQKPGFSLKSDEPGTLLITLTPSSLRHPDNFTFANQAFHQFLNLLSKCRLESKNLQGILDRYEDYLSANKLEKYSTKPVKHAFSIPGYGHSSS